MNFFLRGSKPGESRLRLVDLSQQHRTGCRTDFRIAEANQHLLKKLQLLVSEERKREKNPNGQVKAEDSCISILHIKCTFSVDS